MNALDRATARFPVNLSFAERAVSAVLGLGLAAVAARPRPNVVLSALALAAGSFLAWRGATGRGPLKALFTQSEDGAGPSPVPARAKTAAARTKSPRKTGKAPKPAARTRKTAKPA